LTVCAVVLLLLFHLWEQAHVTQLDSRIRSLCSDISTIRIENSRLTADVISLSEWGILLERAEVELNMTYPSVDDLTLIQQSTRRTFSPDEREISAFQ